EHRLAEHPQVVGVVVVGLLPGQCLEVAVHVRQHEEQEDDPGDGHDELEGDRRAATLDLPRCSLSGGHISMVATSRRWSGPRTHAARCQKGGGVTAVSATGRTQVTLPWWSRR